MSDYDADAEDLPEPQLQSDGDGSGRQPRETAVGSSGPGPKRWVAQTEAQDSKPVPYESIYEMLHVEEGANFEVMSRAHKYLVHSLDTSYFKPNQRKIKQQALLNLLWNGWHRSPESRNALTSEKVFANRAIDNLNHYQVFQVSPSAKLGIIKAVYEYLERLYHPDNQATGDQDKYKIVTEAWAVLSEGKSREQYDQSLK